MLAVFAAFSVSTTQARPSHASTCDHLLLQSTAQGIAHDLSNPEQFRNGLAIDLAGYSAVKSLGTGWSGAVVMVQKDGKFYALKILKEKMPDLGSEEANEWHREMESRETGSSLVIQQHLSSLGIAPKISGIIGERAIQKWIATQDQKTRQINYLKPRLGILMEYVPGISTKNPDNTILLSWSQWQTLLERAEQLDRILAQIRIDADDPDAVVSEEGQIKLIDLSFYKMATPKTRNNPWVKLDIMRLRANGHIIVEQSPYLDR